MTLLYTEYIEHLCQHTEVLEQIATTLASDWSHTCRLVRTGVEVESVGWYRTQQLANQTLALINQDYASKLLRKIQRGETTDINQRIRAFVIATILRRVYNLHTVHQLMNYVPTPEQHFLLVNLMKDVPLGDQSALLALLITTISERQPQEVRPTTEAIKKLPPEERLLRLRQMRSLMKQAQSFEVFQLLLDQFSQLDKKDISAIAQSISKNFGQESSEEQITKIKEQVAKQQEKIAYF